MNHESSPPHPAYVPPWVDRLRPLLFGWTLLGWIPPLIAWQVYLNTELPSAFVTNPQLERLNSLSITAFYATVLLWLAALFFLCALGVLALFRPAED
jgi:hypothetical protein